VTDNHNNHNEDLQTEDREGSPLKYEGLGSAFNSHSSSSPIDQLVQPGKDPLGIAMRTIFQDARTEGSIMSIATARDLADCVEFEDNADAQELLTVMAGDSSIRGTARNQLVDAYIGERRHQEGGGFIDRVKGMFAGSGDKENKNG
jgi:hypothetical protein